MRLSPVHWILLTTQLLFGTLPLTGQYAMRGIPPLGVATLRIVGAALVLGLFAGRRLFTLPRADYLWLVLYSFLGIVGNQVLFLEGLSRTTQTNAAVLITTIPVFTVAFALLLGRERSSWLKLAGVAAGLAGAMLLARIERFDLSESGVLGNLMVIANSSLWAMYLVLARPMLQRVDPLVVVAWMFLFGSLMVLPFGLPKVVSAVAVARPEHWAAAAWVVAGPTIGAYLLNVWGLRLALSSQVAIYVYIQPLVAGVLAQFFVGEPLTLRTLLAAVLIFVGVAAVYRSGRPRSTQPAAPGRLEP